MSAPPPASPLPRPAPDRPRSKRAALAHALDSVGLLDRLLAWRARAGVPALTVLTYHRAGLPGSAGELDPGVVEVEPDTFAEHLTLLRSRATLVTMSDVVRFARGGRLPANAVLLTFDDGYADARDVVLPILERASAPATFFIPTAYPGAGSLFWWDRVSLLMRRCRRERIELDYPRRLTLEPARHPEAAATAVRRVIKSTPGIDLGRTFEALESATDVRLGVEEERALAARTILDWSGIRSLRAAGMDVESHAHSHRVLDTLTPVEAERDLARSREILRAELGVAPRAVAYPVGYPLVGPFRAAAAVAGFDVGFTNGTGLCATRRFDPLNLPRLSMGPDHRGATFKLLLLLGQRPGPRATA